MLGAPMKNPRISRVFYRLFKAAQTAACNSRSASGISIS